MGSPVRLPCSLLGSQSRQALRGARDLAARRLRIQAAQALTEVRKLQGRNQLPRSCRHRHLIQVSNRRFISSLLGQ